MFFAGFIFGWEGEPLNTLQSWIIAVLPITTSLALTYKIWPSDTTKHNRATKTQTPVEQGKINGQPFVKCSWAGIATSAARAGLSGRKMHGIVYLTIHNNDVVQIMCQDVALEHEESLKLGGCAALTFRVAPAQVRAVRTQDKNRSAYL